MKGHSTNRPPLFDRPNYQFWNNRMSIYMRSCDYEMWDVVMDDPYVPTKTKGKSEELESKLQSKWTDAEMKKVQLNFKAMNTLHCVLTPTEFNRILTCKSTKEIWDKLKVITIQEAKNLNKISLDEICSSLLTYEQEVNQIDEEEKLEVVEKEKGLALKTSSKEEEMFYTSCEDEESKIQPKANLCFMVVDDEVCDDELDDYDILNNEYQGLLVDFEKLLHKCTKYRKIIDKLTL